jgi:hypothetical protein
VVTVASDGERRARVALSFLARPGDPVLGAALRTRTAAAALALVTGADADGEALLAGELEDIALGRAIQRSHLRLTCVAVSALLAWGICCNGLGPASSLRLGVLLVELAPGSGFSSGGAVRSCRQAGPRPGWSSTWAARSGIGSRASCSAHN